MIDGFPHELDLRYRWKRTIRDDSKFLAYRAGIIELPTVCNSTLCLPLSRKHVVMQVGIWCDDNGPPAVYSNL